MSRALREWGVIVSLPGRIAPTIAALRPNIPLSRGPDTFDGLFSRNDSEDPSEVKILTMNVSDASVY